MNTLPSPVNLKPLHLPVAHTITKPVTGRNLLLHPACFLADYKRGQSKDTATLLSPAQLCSAPSSFEGCCDSLYHCYFCCLCWGLLRAHAKHCLCKKRNILQHPFPPYRAEDTGLQFAYFGTRASIPSSPLNTRTMDGIANSTRLTFQGMLTHFSSSLFGSALGCGSCGIGALHFYPSCSHLGQEGSTMKTPWGHPMAPKEEHCRASSSLPAQGLQKPPTI